MRENIIRLQVVEVTMGHTYAVEHGEPADAEPFTQIEAGDLDNELHESGRPTCSNDGCENEIFMGDWYGPFGGEYYCSDCVEVID